MVDCIHSFSVFLLYLLRLVYVHVHNLNYHHFFSLENFRLEDALIEWFVHSIKNPQEDDNSPELDCGSSSSVCSSLWSSEKEVMDEIRLHLCVRLILFKNSFGRVTNSTSFSSVTTSNPDTCLLSLWCNFRCGKLLILLLLAMVVLLSVFIIILLLSIMIREDNLIW